MSSIARQISCNLATVRERIAVACERSGRNPDDVTLVCVTKYAKHEWVEGLLECGERILGENRPQQLAERAEQFPPDVQWHLVGQLQRNKVRKTLDNASLIHSVDSIRLLNRIETIALEEGRTPDVLLQVNVSGEAAKSGFTPDALRDAWPEVCELARTRVQGLMTMAPLTESPEECRPYFESLAGLAEELKGSHPESNGPVLTELSMGMSGDFEVAVEAGATMIRLGRSLFSGLAPTDSPVD